jgi:excinuclease ABC subunit A
MLQSLARHYKFDVEAPWEVLDEKVQNLVLYGSGKETIAFQYPGEKGRSAVKSHAFEGVVPNLERRYRETDSVVVKEELAKLINQRLCPDCGGTRLRREARHVKVADQTIFEISALPLRLCHEFFSSLKLEGAKGQVAERIVREIANRLEFLVNVGLDYLSLDRAATTLSGGEAQRIKLAKELSKRQTGKTLYILDEPTTGLHFEDVSKLLDVLQNLVELGNTVVVIEHNLDVIKTADWIIDLGPEGGERGGAVVAFGTPEEILRNPKSYTAQALRKMLGKGRAA